MHSNMCINCIRLWSVSLALYYNMLFFFHLYSKCGDLEEALKTSTNDLKSLEAQSDKVSVFSS